MEKSNYEKFSTDEDLIERLAKELKGVTRIKRIGDITSVEYDHNQWRDEFATVDQIVAELQKQHMA